MTLCPSWVAVRCAAPVELRVKLDCGSVIRIEPSLLGEEAIIGFASPAGANQPTNDNGTILGLALRCLVES